MKRTLIAAALAATSLASFATDYFVVVPVKGRTASAQQQQPVIAVTLQTATLPSAEVGKAYSYNLATNLLVTGDASLDLSLATLATADTLPAGLTLASTGVLAGTPTTASAGTSFQVLATYKGKTGQQAYTLVVSPKKDPSFSAVTLLLHADGADASTVVTDSSGTPKTGVVAGAAKLSTAQYKFGTSSFTLSSGDSIQFPANAAFDMTAGDFTAEAWVRPSATGATQRIMLPQNGGSTNGNYSYILELDSSLQFRGNVVYGGGAGQNTFVPSGITLAAGTWNHVALVRSGTTYRAYVNGVGGTATTIGTINSTGATTYFTVGKDRVNGLPFVGQIDEVRLTNGVARYTANFTVPTTPFENQ